MKKADTATSENAHPVSESTSNGVGLAAPDMEGKSQLLTGIFPTIGAGSTGTDDDSSVHLKAFGDNTPTGIDADTTGLEQELNDSHGQGSPLPDERRAEMEAVFGGELGNVRIHSDERSARLSTQLNARAFTHGADIYFNAGQYQPDSVSGRRLLAHELTHVVQQASSPTDLVQRDALPEREDISLEEELEQSRQVLAAIHERLRWRVTTEEAQEISRILRETRPSVLLRVIQTLRLGSMSSRRIARKLQRFLDALPEEDRAQFDQFSLNYDREMGYLAVNDTVRIEVFASPRQREPEFTLDLNVTRRGVEPFFLEEPVRIDELLPQQAAERLAQEYRDQQLFVEPSVRLVVLERGPAYAPRHGETSQSMWFEGTVTLPADEAARRTKQREFLDYIGAVTISDDTRVNNAYLYYFNWISENFESPEFLERTPIDLWDWALAEAYRPPPVSPAQPFLDLYLRMNHRYEAATEAEERTVLLGALNRYLDWLDDHMDDPNLSSYDPVEIWTRSHRRAFSVHLSTLREAAFERQMEEIREREAIQTRAQREARWEEHFQLALQLWGYSSRNYPYTIPIPSEGRDILVTGDPARQAVFDRLAEELMSWATSHMHDPVFLERSPERALLDIIEGGYEEPLAEANRRPLEWESIDRNEILPGRALASFGQTVATGLLVIAVAGAAVGAGIVSAPVAALVLAGVAGAAAITSYMERREEIEEQHYDVPVPESMLHSVGDVVGLSQLIEGITGERLGTGRRLSSIERSDELGEGGGGVVLLLTGSRAYRSGQLRGQRFRLSRRGATPPGPEGGAVPNPRDTPPVDVRPTPPSESPGPVESAVRGALEQRIRVGFDRWMAEIRENGGDPEVVLNRMPAGRRNRIAQRRAEDFTRQFEEALRQEEIRIRSMDNPLNPRMRNVEQARPGEDGVLIMYNEHPPEAFEIQQALRIFDRTGEPIRLFGDTASGRAYPGIDGTIGRPPRPLSLKHGAAEANPNFARFQAEEALIKARDNGYAHVEVHIEMEGATIRQIQAAWEAPPNRPGQSELRPIFDAVDTVARIIIQGTDGQWVVEPPLSGRGLPGVVVPDGDSERE